jgi:Ca2+-binding EF-hand superfamily protein
VDEQIVGFVCVKRMGKSQSRIITPADARARVSDQDWTRFNRGFDRLSSRDGYMSKEAFFEVVLGSSVPKELAERLFAVFDFNNRGALSKDDFLCGMVLLSAGSPDEKIKFLFNVYDLDKEGSIHKDNLRELAKFLKDVSPAVVTPTPAPAQTTTTGTQFNSVQPTLLTPLLKDQPPSQETAASPSPPSAVAPSAPAQSDVHRTIDDMFKAADVNEDDRVSFEEFKQWAQENMTPGLVSWILELAPKGKPSNSHSESLKKGIADGDGAGASIWRSRTATIASLTHCKKRFQVHFL